MSSRPSIEVEFIQEAGTTAPKASCQESAVSAARGRAEDVLKPSGHGRAPASGRISGLELVRLMDESMMTSASTGRPSRSNKGASVEVTKDTRGDEDLDVPTFMRRGDPHGIVAETGKQYRRLDRRSDRDKTSRRGR
ncbi:MAG: hypothetical protein V1760_01245 [Candidatus Peregrinibacteria bacterium]